MVTQSAVVVGADVVLFKPAATVTYFPFEAAASVIIRQFDPTVAHSGSNVCVQGPVQLSNTTTGTGVCGVSVTFQYPFQFWLPFTSLNKQRVLLIASARVRMETQ